MEVLDLGDCELNDESLAIIANIVETKKITKLLDLSKCTGPSRNNGERRLLCSDKRVKLKQEIEKIHPCQFLFDPITNNLPEFKLFEVDQSFSTAQDAAPANDPSENDQVKHTFYNQLWLEEDTGIISSIFFKEKSDLHTTPYDLNTVLLSTPIELELEENEEISAKMQCPSPRGINYELDSGNTPNFTISHELNFTITFFRCGEAPGEEKLKLKYIVCKRDGLEIANRSFSCPVTRMNRGATTTMPTNEGSTNLHRPTPFKARTIQVNNNFYNNGGSRNTGTEMRDDSRIDSFTMGRTNVGGTQQSECREYIRAVDETSSGGADSFVDVNKRNSECKGECAATFV